METPRVELGEQVGPLLHQARRKMVEAWTRMIAGEIMTHGWIMIIFLYFKVEGTDY